MPRTTGWQSGMSLRIFPLGIHAFSAGMKCWHCITNTYHLHGQLNYLPLRIFFIFLLFRNEMLFFIIVIFVQTNIFQYFIVLHIQ